MRYNPIMEYYSAIKRNGLMIHATMQMNLKEASLKRLNI